MCKGHGSGMCFPTGGGCSLSCVIPTHIQTNFLCCPGPALLAAGKERCKTRMANGYFAI